MKYIYVISLIRGPRPDIEVEMDLELQAIEYDYDEAMNKAISFSKRDGALASDDSIRSQIEADCFRWQVDDFNWVIYVQFIEIDN